MSTATAEAAPSPSAPMSFADVLRIDVMRRVWYAQMISLFGDWLALFAVIAVVSFAMHGSPKQIIGVQNIRNINEPITLMRARFNDVAK